MLDSAILLDGPMGTELLDRGVPTPLPGWSAHAMDSDPDVIRQIHADFAAAGATVQTANTFRTKERQFPDRWRQLTGLAVELARQKRRPGTCCNLCGRFRGEN